METRRNICSTITEGFTVKAELIEKVITSDKSSIFQHDLEIKSLVHPPHRQVENSINIIISLKTAASRKLFRMKNTSSYRNSHNQRQIKGDP